MNQIQIGRFIAASRKARNLTQRQLADKLGISDKTVSKWECGKGPLFGHVDGFQIDPKIFKKDFNCLKGMEFI